MFRNLTLGESLLFSNYSAFLSTRGAPAPPKGGGGENDGANIEKNNVLILCNLY